MELCFDPVLPTFRKGCALCEDSQASRACPSDQTMKIGMECWWNVTDRGKLKFWENKTGNVQIT